MTAIALEEEALSAYVGEYAIAGAPVKFTIRRGGEALEAQLTGQPFLPVFAKGDDVFFYTAVDAELHVERDDTGSVIALTLHQGPIRQRAERIRQAPLGGLARQSSLPDLSVCSCAW